MKFEITFQAKWLRFKNKKHHFLQIFDYQYKNHLYTFLRLKRSLLIAFTICRQIVLNRTQYQNN